MNLASYFPTISSLLQIPLRYTKSFLKMIPTFNMTSYKPSMTLPLLGTQAFQTLGNLSANNTRALDSENL